MYNPEQDKIINFPIERVRVHHVDAAIDNLEAAVLQIKPETAPEIPLFQSPVEVAAAQQAITADQAIDLALLRRQILEIDQDQKRAA